MSKEGNIKTARKIIGIAIILYGIYGMIVTLGGGGGPVLMLVWAIVAVVGVLIGFPEVIKRGERDNAVQKETDNQEKIK